MMNMVYMADLQNADTGTVILTTKLFDTPAGAVRSLHLHIKRNKPNVAYVCNLWQINLTLDICNDLLSDDWIDEAKQFVAEYK